MNVAGYAAEGNWQIAGITVKVRMVGRVLREEVDEVKRSIAATLFGLVLLLSGPQPSAQAVQTPDVTAVFTAGSRTYTVNGQAETMAVASFVDNADNRLYVPVRSLAAALGVASQDIDWNAATGAVTLNLEEKDGWGRDVVLNLVIGGKTISVTNGPGSKGIQAQFVSLTKVQMDAAPEILGGHAMVPARWIAQSFGYNLRWDQANQQMVITG